MNDLGTYTRVNNAAAPLNPENLRDLDVGGTYKALGQNRWPQCARKLVKERTEVWGNIPSFEVMQVLHDLHVKSTAGTGGGNRGKGRADARRADGP